MIKRLLHDLAIASLCGILIGFIMLCLSGDLKMAACAFAGGTVGYFIAHGDATH